jgi:hypothetical protein
MVAHIDLGAIPVLLNPSQHVHTKPSNHTKISPPCTDDGHGDGYLIPHVHRKKRKKSLT